MMWKPRLIAMIFNKIANDDIIVFHDLNYLKYPQYVDGIENWRASLINLHHASNILLFRDCFKPLAIDCKRYLINVFLNNYKYPDSLPGFWAGMVSFKKSKNSRKFLQTWIELTESVKNVSPYPDCQTQSERFTLHSPEQVTLALVYYGFKKKCNFNIRIVYVRGRKFPVVGINSLFFISYLFEAIKELLNNIKKQKSYLR